MYGHIYKMSEAVERVPEKWRVLRWTFTQVAELIPESTLERSRAKVACQAFAHISGKGRRLVGGGRHHLRNAHTIWKHVRAQMRNFLDQTGPLWLKGSLIGKVGSVFTSTATQHGGQETTITSFHTTLLHQGMVIVGVPDSQQGLVNMKEITGGSP